jgi:uncharacterized protein (TIGR00297 family)
LPLAADFLRIAAGFVLSIAIAAAARRGGALSRSGAVTAIVVATACTAAGWSWAWLLISFFSSATILSKAGESVKRSRAHDIVEKSANRDMWQVLANGGVFAMFALVSLVSHSTLIPAAAAGALAASTADTWSTEIGMLSPSMPRSVLTMKPVPHGTSGAVTIEGLIASVAGGGFIALIAVMLGWPLITACSAIAGGVGGSLIDSLIGATIQEKRWCEQCACGTERAVHTCGTATISAGGVRGLDNDVVNFLSSIGGALVGSLCLL